MEFTREAWETAPEGARLEMSTSAYRDSWHPVHLIGFARSGFPVVEMLSGLRNPHPSQLRIILPKRKVTVQLWRMASGNFTTAYVDEERWRASADWTLLGEHTFEIEGE